MWRYNISKLFSSLLLFITIFSLLTGQAASLSPVPVFADGEPSELEKIYEKLAKLEKEFEDKKQKLEEKIILLSLVNPYHSTGIVI